MQGAGRSGQLFCGVQHPLRDGADSWAAANPRGSSPEQPDLEGLSENVGRSFHGVAKLVLAFSGLQGLLQWAGGAVRLFHWNADPRELERLAGLLQTQEALPQSSPTQKDCPKIKQIFPQPGQACSSFSGVQGFLQGAGSPGELFRGSAAPPEGWSS